MHNIAKRLLNPNKYRNLNYIVPTINMYVAKYKIFTNIIILKLVLKLFKLINGLQWEDFNLDMIFI